MAKKKASKKKGSSRKSSPKKKAPRKVAPVVKAPAPPAVSSSHQGSILGPVLLIAIGLYLLGRDVGWFHIDSSLWSILIIILGLIWMFGTLDVRQA